MAQRSDQDVAGADEAYFDGADVLTAAHALPGWFPHAFLSVGTARGSATRAAPLLWAPPQAAAPARRPSTAAATNLFSPCQRKRRHGALFVSLRSLEFFPFILNNLT
jgi:hypothetical protein